MRTTLAVGCLAIFTLPPALFGQGNAAIASPEAERALIARYCLGCHSQSAKKAGCQPRQ